MRINRWHILMALGLVAASVALYGLHYLLFHDAHHIWIYLVGDIAFLPAEVLLVTLVLHQLLELREKRSRLNKLNMLIGVFFTEVGTEMLRQLHDTEADGRGLRDRLLIGNDWTNRDFATAAAAVRAADCTLELDPPALQQMRELLLSNRASLVGLLQNPMLLEHQSFTNLLWAVFHFMEELARREDFAALPPSDVKHLSGDACRVYERLIVAWLAYVRHLKRTYPYLYSLAVRTNPFAENASPVVE